jgi:two-component system OmpR family sensor kinase
MLRSIQFKLTLVFLLVILAAQLIVVALMTRAMRGYGQQNAVEWMTYGAQRPVHLITQLMTGLGASLSDSARIAVLRRPGARPPSPDVSRVVVVDAYGLVVASRGPEVPPVGQIFTQPEVQTVLRKKLKEPRSRVQDGIVHIAAPIIINDYLQGVYYVARPLPSRSLWDFLLRDMQWQWRLPVAFTLAALFGYLISRTITNPLRQMMVAAESIASGNFKERVRVRSRDEIGRLGDKFNVMTERVEDLLKQVSQERDRLSVALTKLQDSERRRQQLIENVSHELRTPLACIQSAAEAVLDGVAADPERREICLRTIHEETQRLSRLVEQLLTLSRGLSDETSETRSAVEIGEIARSAVQRFLPRAAEKQIRLDVAVTDEPCWVTGNSDQLMQVLLNLLDNAIKYTECGGEVHVSVRPVNESVVVKVKDNGIGIAADELPYIFDRFYRTDKSRSRATGGSGLGLALVREIVEAHGGTVQAESAPEVGTEITFCLPSASAEAAGSRQHATAART